MFIYVCVVLLGYGFSGEGNAGAMIVPEARGRGEFPKDEGMVNACLLMKQAGLWWKTHPPSLIGVLSPIASV